ncbi:MAG: hypothetical protein AAF830_06655 [Pseudomonadota bacterium]
MGGRLWVFGFVFMALSVGFASAEGVCGPAPEALGQFDDRDFRRMPDGERAWLDDLCISEGTVRSRGADIGITEVRHQAKTNDLVFAVLHDDENEAFRAMVWAVHVFGGRGIAVEFDERRYLKVACPPRHAECDPNRIFGRRGFSAYTEYFRAAFESVPLVIAMHTNRPAGIFDVDTVKSTDICSANDQRDDFILAGEMNPGATMTCEREDIAGLVAMGHNVAYLIMDPVEDPYRECREGCDLQAYAMRNLGKTYFNLEAVRGGGVDTHKSQLCAVLDPGGENYQCTPYIGETEKNFTPILEDEARPLFGGGR